jgi:dTDP-4-dehydrorhamnose reductase
MLKLGKNQSNLSVVRDQIGSPTFADDLADFCFFLLQYCEQYSDQKIPFGIYNFCNTGFTSWADFAREIFKIVNIDVELKGIPSSEYPTKAVRPLNSKMSLDKIKSTFNYIPRDWKSALNQFLQDIS